MRKIFCGLTMNHHFAVVGPAGAGYLRAMHPVWEQPCHGAGWQQLTYLFWRSPQMMKPLCIKPQHRKCCVFCHSASITNMPTQNTSCASKLRPCAAICGRVLPDFCHQPDAGAGADRPISTHRRATSVAVPTPSAIVTVCRASSAPPPSISTSTNVAPSPMPQ